MKNLSLLPQILRIAMAVVIAVTLACAPTPAMASGGGGHGGGGHGGGEAKKADKKPPKKGEFSSITGGLAGEDDPIYLHLTPLTFPIISDYGAEQLISMLVDLHIKDMESAQMLQKNMPKLKDSLMVALYGSMLYDGEMRNSQAVNIEKIKQEIQTTINKAFAGDYVQAVFVQGVAQRKL